MRRPLPLPTPTPPTPPPLLAPPQLLLALSMTVLGLSPAVGAGTNMA